MEYDFFVLTFPVAENQDVDKTRKADLRQAANFHPYCEFHPVF